MTAPSSAFSAAARRCCSACAGVARSPSRLRGSSASPCAVATEGAGLRSWVAVLAVSASGLILRPILRRRLIVLRVAPIHRLLAWLIGVRRQLGWSVRGGVPARVDIHSIATTIYRVAAHVAAAIHRIPTAIYVRVSATVNIGVAAVWCRPWIVVGVAVVGIPVHKHVAVGYVNVAVVNHSPAVPVAVPGIPSPTATSSAIDRRPDHHSDAKRDDGRGGHVRAAVTGVDRYRRAIHDCGIVGGNVNDLRISRLDDNCGLAPRALRGDRLLRSGLEIACVFGLSAVPAPLSSRPAAG
jgi:hypothetical protein